jgi:hypothetical protein
MPDADEFIAHLDPGVVPAGAPPNDLTAPAPGPGSGQSTAPDADLTEVLVNYNEVFQAVHGRYIQILSQLMQENAELRAGFNQAVARMKASEARAEAMAEALQC